MAEDDVPEPDPLSKYHRRLVGVGAVRAVELAREVLRERGLSEEEIAAELDKTKAPINPPLKG